MIDVYESEGNMFDLEYINRLRTRLSGAKPSPNCIATSPNLVVHSHGTNGNTEFPKTPVETSSNKQSSLLSYASSRIASSGSSNSLERAEGNLSSNKKFRVI